MSVSSCLCGSSVRINEEVRSGPESWLKLPGPLQGQGKGPQAVRASSRPFPDVLSLIVRNILGQAQVDVGVRLSCGGS